MELRRFNHFIALVEEKRFAQAAKKVHLSQAAFSRSIQALEERLGVTLIDRSSTKVLLTEEGEVVLRRARQMVRESQLLAHDLHALRTGDGELSGDLVIGVGGAAVVALLPSMITRIVRSSPKVNLDCRSGYLPDLLDRMENGFIDLCVGDPRNIRDSERYAMRPVGRVRSGLYCRTGHPLLSGEMPIDIPSVSRFGIATTASTGTVQDIMVSLYGLGEAEDLPNRVHCQDMMVLCRLVEEHDMVSFLPATVVEHCELDFKALPVPGNRAIFVENYAIWLKDRPLMPLVEFAIDVAEQMGNQLEQEYPAD